MIKLSMTTVVIMKEVSNFLYWNGSLNTPSGTSIQADIMAMFKSIDSNYYRSDIAAPFNWIYHLRNGGKFFAPAAINFSGWQRYVGRDAHSFVLPVAATLYKINPTAKAVVYDLGGYNYTDATGVRYTNRLTLQPFTSKVLFKETK